MIRFDERRAQLSVGERAAFQEIARQLDRFTGQPAANDDTAEQRPNSDVQPADTSEAADTTSEPTDDVSTTTVADEGLLHAAAEEGNDDAIETDADRRDAASEVEAALEIPDAHEAVEGQAGDASPGEVSAEDEQAEHERADEPVDADIEAPVSASPSADHASDETIAQTVDEPVHSGDGHEDAARDEAVKASLSAIDDDAEFAPQGDASAVTADAAGSAETASLGNGQAGAEDESQGEAVDLTDTPSAAQNAEAQPEEASERELLNRMMPGRERIGLSAEIIDQMPVALLVHSGDDLIHGNPEFLRLTGYGSIGELAEIGGLDALLQRQELEGKTANASGMVVVRAMTRSCR